MRWCSARLPRSRAASDTWTPDPHGIIRDLAFCSNCEAFPGWACRSWGEDVEGRVHNIRTIRLPLGGHKTYHLKPQWMHLDPAYEPKVDLAQGREHGERLRGMK